jgi:UDP-hydrolysing UDP-N-acetyl-D-glucosamine 2-epimerase
LPRKVCVVVTARASYARIKTALEAIAKDRRLSLQIVVTGSSVLEKYGCVAKVMVREGHRIDWCAYSVLEGENPVTSAKSTGLAVSELATAFDALRPDCVVTIADRYETLATSIAASYMNIPLVHVQGGEVTGSIDEKVRHANTKLADLHLVATRGARERVIKLGEDPDKVHVTGCPSIDLAASVGDGPIMPRDEGVGGEIDMMQPFILVMQHPVTTDYGMKVEEQIITTLCAVRELDVQAFWFWPNADAGSDYTSQGMRRFRERYSLPHVRFIKNLPPENFLRLLKLARCIVGNSSVAIRECSYLGVPAVNIGDRQAGRDRGHNVTDAGHSQSAIVGAIKSQMAHGRYDTDTLYGTGRAGELMAEVLATAPLTIEKRITY